MRCSIYEQRPSVCREVAPSGQEGVTNPWCDRARALWGLPPLELTVASGQERYLTQEESEVSDVQKDRFDKPDRYAADEPFAIQWDSRSSGTHSSELGSRLASILLEQYDPVWGLHGSDNRDQPRPQLGG